MFSWIKNNAILLLVSALATAIVASSSMFVMWRMAEQDAQEAKDLVREQVQIIHAQTLITENETQVDRVTVDVVQRALEAPNAQILVPPDLADAYIDGLNRVRDSAASTDGKPEDVQRPKGDNPKSRRTKMG